MLLKISFVQEWIFTVFTYERGQRVTKDRIHALLTEAGVLPLPTAYALTAAMTAAFGKGKVQRYGKR